MATLRQCRSSMPKFKFAPDSALEGRGFEPSVPPESDDGFETAPFDRCGTSRDRLLRESGQRVRIPFPSLFGPIANPLEAFNSTVAPPPNWGARRTPAPILKGAAEIG